MAAFDYIDESDFYVSGVSNYIQERRKREKVCGEN